MLEIDEIKDEKEVRTHICACVLCVHVARELAFARYRIKKK